MKTNILPAIRLTVVTLIFFAVLYPVLIWAIAQLAPDHGNGEKSSFEGKPFFLNVGQNFTEDAYFTGRPSAVDYNSAGSGGSNKGPSNAEYLSVVQARIDTFLVHNPKVSRSQVPVEMVTASGSGLDPDISPKAALVQVERIAGVRKISKQQLEQIITANTEHSLLGLFGPERVNVLKLNMALQKL